MTLESLLEIKPDRAGGPVKPRPGQVLPDGTNGTSLDGSPLSGSPASTSSAGESFSGKLLLLLRLGIAGIIVPALVQCLTKHVLSPGRSMTYIALL